MKRNTHTTREGWLVDAMAALDKEFFAENGYELPEKLQVSCGFPRGISKAIGQCCDPQVSADGTTQMFICPSLGKDPIQVLGVLLHEMIHAAVGIECGHRGAFRKLAKEFGLEGKMTATFVAEETDLHRKMEVINGRLGPYPHAPMKKTQKRGKGGSGWVRLMSPEDETYTLVISPKVLEEAGAPTDPWGNEMVPKK